MATHDQVIRDRLSAYKKAHKDKVALLSDAAKMDKYVSGISQHLSPTTKMASKKKADLRVDRVDRSIDESSSMKGFGPEFRSNFTAELAKPENAGYSANKIAMGITKGMLNERDEKGRTRLEKAYAEYRVEESNRDFFFLSGKKKSAKAPTGLPGMPTYEEWKTKTREQEDRAIAEGGSEFLANLAADVWAGTVTGAGIGTIAATPGAGTVAGGVIGGTAAAAASIVTHPIKKWLSGTEWYRSREASDKISDNIVAGVAKFGPDVVATLRFEKAINVSARAFTAARNAALTKPTAVKLIEWKGAKDALKSDVKKAVVREGKAEVRPTNMKKSDGVKAINRLNKEKDLGLSSKEVQSFGKKYGVLSKKGQAEALTHPEGLAKGILVQSEKESAMAAATGKINPDIVVKERTAPKKTKIVKKAEEVAKSKVIAAKADDTVIELGPLKSVTEEVITETKIKKTKAGKDILELVGRTSDEDKIATAVQKTDNYFNPKAVSEGKLAVPKPVGKETSIPETITEEFAKVKQVTKAYDEVGDYYDELIIKYNPELKLPPKTGRLSADEVKMEEAITKASRTIESKLTPAETNKLNEMLTRYDDLERTIVKVKEEIPDIGLDEMRSGMVKIMDAERAGTLTAAETIKQVDDIALRVERSDTLLGVDKSETLGAMAEYTAKLRKQAGIISFFAAFGVGATMLESLTADEAEAGIANVLGKVGREALEKAVTSTITGIKKQRLSVGRVMSDDVFHLPEKAFQTGLMETTNGGAKYFTQNLNKIYRHGSKRFAQGAMSPQSIFTEVLKTTEGTLLNPAVFKATFFNAEAINVKNGLRVMSNIFKEANIASAKTEIAEMFSPLAKKAKKQYVHDYHTQMAGEYKAKIMKLKNPDKETVNGLKLHMYKHNGMAKKLKFLVEEYHTEYQRTARAAATKHSSARVFFAADDSIKFEKYPFMKNMKLSEDEMLAVGRLKNQMIEYRIRLEKNGTKTISGEYMHYALHPEVRGDMLAELVGNNTATPYMKNFTRSANARPLVPDAVDSMGKYIPDAERRIQTQAFWNSGWKEAMKASAHIKPLHTAFQALEEGTKPFESTWTNNLARWYTNIEVFKRLFLSPSAGLKHLVKLTGDMATLGVGETLSAMPGSLKTVSHRIIENTPFMKKIAGNLYNPSQYTKMKKQLLDSVAPAMDTRYRMMQMGFGNYDSYFSKLGVLADKVNHIGGVWINMAELIDRGTTMEAGLRIAAKKGMTPDQAIYGIYDTILKNNFLGREFTPRWMREPVFKAAFMFQTTPAKILGKKLVMAMRSKRAIKDGGKKIFNATKTPEGRQKLYTDLMNLTKDMRATDQALKVNLFIDAYRTVGKEQDFYGNKVVGQFAKDIMIMGAGTAAAGSVGLNMSHHFFHIPFLKNSDYADTYGTLALSPAANAIKDGSREYNKKIAEDEDSIWAIEVIQKWAGKSGPWPDTLSKYNRISDDDIPEIYQDNPLQYLFALPSKKED